MTTEPTLPDLTNLAYRDTMDYAVRHPATGAPLAWIITLAGPSHPATIAADEEVFRQTQLALQDRQRQAITTVKAGQTPVPPIETLFERRILNAAVVKARVLACGPAVLNGRTLAMADDVRALIDDPRYDWLYRQLDRRLGDASGFIGSALPTSSPTAEANSGAGA